MTDTMPDTDTDLPIAHHPGAVDANGMHTEPEWASDPNTGNRWVTGIWKRAEAGLNSLIARAFLPVQSTGTGRARSCSQFGDTDQPMHVIVGEIGPDVIGRAAEFRGFLILHRTVGGRACWSVRGNLSVRGSDGTVSRFALGDTGLGWESALANRLVSELAAQVVENQGSDADTDEAWTEAHPPADW
jgi:hypothetical protein